MSSVHEKASADSDANGSGVLESHWRKELQARFLAADTVKDAKTGERYTVVANHL